ncbi:Serine/threonine-protein phosphatase 2A regulatory subunit B'' subunit beta [Dipsacomyces acuminosporus]|nr:Serine/threonine-protein phosphatase 2A regulatory subunit B'' subunit beta [Dipsacomyces acuminosporus]
MGSATANASAMTTPQKKDRAVSQNNPLLSSPILQADELCLNPRWSPHLKSPPPNSTISSRLRLQNSPLAPARTSPAKAAAAAAAGPDENGLDSMRGSANSGQFTSPLSKRARILQADSPESLPPLSPVVSNKRRAFRADLTQDTPFPFSPTASGLRIQYSPSSPLSPSIRSTPNRGEPESPTLTRMLVKDSPSLSLDEKLGSTGADEESPTMAQMSRNLLFRLDLESPTARRTGSAAEGGMAQSPFSAAEKGKRASSLQSSLRSSSVLGLAMDEDDTSEYRQQHEDDDAVVKKTLQSTATAATPAMRRPSNALRDMINAKLEQKRRKTASSASAAIPQLYISPSRPRMDHDIERIIAQQLDQARKHFDRNFGAREADFTKVTEECGLPRFVNRALFRYVTRDSKGSAISPSSGNTIIGKRMRHTDKESWPSYEHFCDLWSRLRRSSADIHALVFNILADDPAKAHAYLTREDIKPLVTDVVDHHYELEFLEGQGQFAQSYTETVIERIFYVANRSWDGKLTLPQFRKADIVGILRSIEDGIDVDVENPSVFSYKHFYVLFCSFFELDSNRDRLLDARDLLRYFSGTLSRRTISRIMMGKGRPSEHNGAEARSKPAKARKDKRNSKTNSRYDLNVRLSDCRMTYRDFVWFLISEIDKTSPTAVEYWFRCLDLDGDGVLTVYELEYFYDEQVNRMEEEMSGDIIMLDDLMCQLSDLVRPEREGMITLKDLRKVPPTLLPVFFDAFMNLTRFLEHEGRTSFLQRQLAQLSIRAMPSASFEDVIRMRMEFLASLPNPWIEFADLEYAALLNDHEQSDENSRNEPGE